MIVGHKLERRSWKEVWTWALEERWKTFRIKFKNKMVILDRIDASVSSAQSERCFCELASLGLLRLRRCIYIEG